MVQLTRGAHLGRQVSAGFRNAILQKIVVAMFNVELLILKCRASTSTLVPPWYLSPASVVTRPGTGWLHWHARLANFLWGHEGALYNS